MKLDASTSGLSANTLQNGNAQPSPAAAPAAQTVTVATTAASGTVHLSPASAALMAAAANASGDVDTGRVSDIKDAIANGTLQIDSEKIADGLMTTTKELIKFPTRSQ